MFWRGQAKQYIQVPQRKHYIIGNSFTFGTVQMNKFSIKPENNHTAVILVVNKGQGDRKGDGKERGKDLRRFGGVSNSSEYFYVQSLIEKEYLSVSSPSHPTNKRPLSSLLIFKTSRQGKGISALLSTPLFSNTSPSYPLFFSPFKLPNIVLLSIENSS